MSERRLLHHNDIPMWERTTETQWRDWRWQLRSCIRDVEKLGTVVAGLPHGQPGDAEVIKRVCASFEFKLTPHTVLNVCRALQSGDNAGANALLSSFVPTAAESGRTTWDLIDGIGEEERESKPARLVTNFYGDRVLLFAANMCASYCRFCFRRRKVGDRLDDDVERGIDADALMEAIAYIRADNRIREVVISGGDPLTLSDDRLLRLLESLRSIDHIKVLRVDTKILTTLPQRITPRLVEIFKTCRPIYVIGNFLHPVELSPETLAACDALTDSGIPVASHTALLRGVNDDQHVIADLMWRLFENRVIPYYLIQFIPTKWTEHFRVPISKGLEIMKHLHGRLSGLANPTYIVYLPDGAGKVPLLPNYLVRRAPEGYYLENFDGRVVLYEEAPDR